MNCENFALLLVAACLQWLKQLNPWKSSAPDDVIAPFLACEATARLAHAQMLL